MAISLPPSPPLIIRRACGSVPQSNATVPSTVTESQLPDDLLLSAQGVQNESYDPVPSTREGSIDLTRNQQYRSIITRRSTPNNTFEHRVIVKDIGNHVHVVLGRKQQVVANLPNEAGIEAPLAETSLPAPGLVTEDTSFGLTPEEEAAFLRESAQQTQQLLEESQAKRSASNQQATTQQTVRVSTGTSTVSGTVVSGRVSGGSGPDPSTGINELELISNPSSVRPLEDTQSALEQLLVQEQDALFGSDPSLLI